MKPAILIGIVLAILIVAAGLCAPYLRSTDRKDAEQAAAQAVLAQRKLDRVDTKLSRLGKLVESDAGLLDDAVQDAAEQLQEIVNAYNHDTRELRQQAEEIGLEMPALPALSANATGVKQALQEFQAALRENQNLLQTVIREAQAAKQLANAVGVAHVLGSAQYVLGASLLADAAELRIEQSSRQARLLDVAARWKRARGYRDHFRGLEVAPIVTQLRGELEELAAARAEAEGRAETLAAQVAQQEQALGAASEALRAAQDEFLEIEQRSFVAGDDESFDAYRAQYQAASQKLQELQQREQELRYGGRRGAELVGEDPATAEIIGGETIIGLEESQRRLATAQVLAQRRQNSHVSLEESIAYLTRFDGQARDEIRRYEERLTELAAEQQAITEDILELAKQASEKEDEALRAIKGAVGAFGQSQQAAQAWVRTAQELQSAHDPDRKNERLNTIVGARYLKQYAQSAEAAARLLEGRLHALRIDSNSRLIDDMQLFGDMNPDFELDPTPFQTLLDEASAAGLDTLDRADRIYDTLAKGTDSTTWVPMATRAAVQHLLARIDGARAGEHATMAHELIAQAVDKREHFPYIKPLVPFRDHMGGAPIGGPVDRGAVGGEEEDVFEFEEEAGDEDDFFDDE